MPQDFALSLTFCLGLGLTGLMWIQSCCHDVRQWDGISGPLNPHMFHAGTWNWNYKHEWTVFMEAACPWNIIVDNIEHGEWANTSLANWDHPQRLISISFRMPWGIISMNWRGHTVTWERDLSRLELRWTKIFSELSSLQSTSSKFSTILWGWIKDLK